MRVLKQVFNPDEFTGYHMLGVICLFFGTIISVNLFLAFSASSTWTGLIVKNTYVESQSFNDKVAILEEQAELGWQASLTAENGNLDILMVGRDGTPLEHAIITANLGRPVQEGEDRIISFTETDHGYSAPADLEPGLWRLQLKAIGPKGEVWVHTIRFNISNSGK